jgi:predicted O-methyltransferase YrrM
MRLDWKTRSLDDLLIDSSVTDNERARLVELATGKTVLEIGSAYGYTTCFLAQVAQSVVAIDPHSGYGSMPHSLTVIQRNITALGLTNIEMLLSRSDAVLPQMRRDGQRFDLVFVDGDHRYDAATYDLHTGWGLVAPGGAMAVHDYGEETCAQVMPAVDAFLAQLQPINGSVQVVDSLCVVKA